MGLIIKWDITYSCNLNCDHCINGQFLGDIQDEINYNEFVKIINTIKEVHEIDYIHFLGGEPTNRNDFLLICKLLDDNNIDFGFNTNGLLLKSELLKQLLSMGHLKDIVLSLEGSNKELNDKVRGKKVFDNMVLVLDRIYKYNNKTRIIINTVVSKYNYLNISDMINFCIDKNVDELSLLEMINEGNAEGKNLSISYNQKIKVLDQIAEKYPEWNEKIDLDLKFVRPALVNYYNLKNKADLPLPNHGCNAGLSFLYIDNKGFFYSCDRVRTKKIQKLKYNLKDEDFKKQWESDDFNYVFKHLESNKYNELKPCNKCKFFKIQCFPCPIESNKDYVTECVKTFELINKYLYDNIQMTYGPLRVNESKDNNTVHHVSSCTTFNLDDKSLRVVKELNKGKEIDLQTLKSITACEENELESFIDFLAINNILIKPESGDINCLKNIEGY